MRFLKSTLLWLVMLAVPAQGFAAATMLSCGAMHERMSSAAEAGHDHDDHGAAGHEHPAGADSPAGDLGKAHDLAKFSCSACATCCVGMALVAAPIGLSLPPTANERIASPPYRESGFLTAGPKRPPRSFLA